MELREPREAGQRDAQRSVSRHGWPRSVVNAAEVLTQLAEQREPLVIMHHGDAKAVLQDVASFEEAQETLALLKILALGQQDVDAGRVMPVAGERLGCPELPDVHQQLRQPVGALQRLCHAVFASIQPHSRSTP